MEMTLIRYDDPKELLQQEWSARREKNSALSLRSFALFLRVSPSRLSEILSGKRKISLGMAELFCERLALAPEVRAAFISAVIRQHKSKLNSQEKKVALQDEVNPIYQQLTIDAFHVISEWYHFAILNLRDCDDFQSDEAWIAKRLNLGVAEVRLALTRLERLELIVWKEKTWARTHANLTTSHDVRSAGLRKGHKGIIEKAIDAIEAVDLENRDITNITMAINPKYLPEAKKMITQFRRKVSKFLEKQTDRTEVYTLAIQLFPLTQSREDKRK